MGFFDKLKSFGSKAGGVVKKIGDTVNKYGNIVANVAATAAPALAAINPALGSAAAAVAAGSRAAAGLGGAAANTVRAAEAGDARGFGQGVTDAVRAVRPNSENAGAIGDKAEKFARWGRRGYALGQAASQMIR